MHGRFNFSDFMIFCKLRKRPFKWCHQSSYLSDFQFCHTMDYCPWFKAEKLQILAPTKFLIEIPSFERSLSKLSENHKIFDIRSTVLHEVMAFERCSTTPGNEVVLLFSLILYTEVAFIQGWPLRGVPLYIRELWYVPA